MLFTWAGTVAPDTILLASRFLLFSWALGLAVASLAAIAVQSTPSPVRRAARGGRQLPGLGAAAGGDRRPPWRAAGVWVTNRQAIVGMWSDRFTLAMMPGAALLLVWLLAWLDRGSWRRSAVLALVLGLAFAAQFRTAHQYSKAWEYSATSTGRSPGGRPPAAWHRAGGPGNAAEPGLGLCHWLYPRQYLRGFP